MEKRIIKFRAWNPHGEMLYSHNNITNPDNFQLKWFFERCHEDAKIMQFTGLLDKEGKEIYENDDLVCDKDGFKGTVEYSTQKAGFWLYSHAEKKYRELHLIGAYGDERGIFIDALVVGNIFQGGEDSRA